MAEAILPYIQEERINLTEKEFRERFNDEFRAFSRCLKEMGRYKFIMKYLFSHRNKTKNDLFNVMLKRKNDGDGTLLYPTMAMALSYLETLGFKDWTDFTPDDSNFWANNISVVHNNIMTEWSKFVNYNKKITIVD